MKTESTAMFIVRVSMTLLIITAVVAALLAGVNSITAPIIREANERKTQEAIEAVLPGGGEAIEVPGGTYLVTAAYASETGYAIQVAPIGFDGEIDMMVGIDKEGSVIAISIIDQSETAGLGAVCAAKTSAGEGFRSQYTGMTGVLSVDKDGGTVDAITGATITSRAVTEGVNAALAFAATLD